ncbi:MAG TPA: P1 family peptidase [Acidimicrobiales bacterium]|nr:P1 family peptidase [Acidimicrobiales bacterium]
MITDVPGLRVGHWTDAAAATGCTVVLFPEGTVASGEVRGGAPATREFALLDPTRTVARLDALMLSGGSAFGLAAADGALRFCEERGMGFPTPAGPVPIVVGLALFDLLVGDPAVRPGPDQGYAACVAATAGPVEVGRVGAGTGATVGGGGAAIPGRVPGAGRRPGGLVTAAARSGDLVVAALVAVNAAGAPGGDDATAVDLAASAGAAAAASGGAAPAGVGMTGFGNTTVGLVATNAALDKLACHLVAQSAHDGLARAVFPAHGRSDGDAFVAAAVGGVPADLDAVRALAVHVVARAIGGLAGRGSPRPGR